MSSTELKSIIRTVRTNTPDKTHIWLFDDKSAFARTQDDGVFHLSAARLNQFLRTNNVSRPLIVMSVRTQMDEADMDGFNDLQRAAFILLDGLRKAAFMPAFTSTNLKMARRTLESA